MVYDKRGKSIIVLQFEIYLVIDQGQELPNSSPKASPKNKNLPKTNNENKQTPLKQTTVAPAPKKRAPASTLPGPAANANSSNVTKRKALSRLTYPHHPRLKNDIPRSEANGKASLMNVTSTKDADKETGKDFDFFSYHGFLPPGHDPWLYFCHSSYQHQPFYAVSADI
ncbi:hypothetical protein V9T40_007721 [Parthenolecanium corni]|uniref:Uncharacterized protein n=1 Tax=Parthenolecanium corni TaxID=536013 RepID=A0AAN9TJW1_9HEMI